MSSLQEVVGKGIKSPLASPALRQVDSPSKAELALTITLACLSVALFLVRLFQHHILLLFPRWLKPFSREEQLEPKPRRWGFWTLCLAIVCLAGFVVSLVAVCLRPSNHWRLLELVPWLSIVALTALDRPAKTPRILLLQYALTLFVYLGLFSSMYLDRSLDSVDPLRLTTTILSVAGIAVIGNMPIRDPTWDSSDIGHPRQKPSHHMRSPEDNLSLFQFWSMSWVYPLARLSQDRELVVEDVWQLPYDFQHSSLYLAFRELKGRLIPRLLEANGLDLFIAATLAVLEQVLEVSNIRLTGRLYKSLDHANINDAIFWCLAMLCIDLIRQVAKTTASWYSRKAYERSRGETFIALFGKLLTRAVPGSDVTEKAPPEDAVLDNEGSPQPASALSRWFSCCGRRKRSRSVLALTQSQPASNAKVVNLVRGDTYEISQRFWEFSRLIAQPIKVVVTIYYLIDIMGWPSCVSLGLMILFLTINSFQVRKSVQFERVRATHTDRRAQAVSHFVEASRPLKLNGWTSSWANRIMKFRSVEMLKRLHISYLTASIGTVSMIGGTVYPLASICLYTLVLGRGLPNDVIWPSITLFMRLETALKEAFDLVSAYWKATIPIERVNKYMAEPDRDEDSSLDPSSRNITFRKATFSWPSTDKNVLKDLDLSFPTGLNIIRGPVGSGKSSLLLAALNEMELHEGSLSRPGEPIGYCQQLPWLQNRTIRDNILFHQRMNPTRYREVLSACALTEDLMIMEAGDLTKLEEGGVGLSGGQKARVALARAVYGPSRILLLDDPLAALDHDTASSIVRNFLQGPLAKDRTIVMVTHRDDLVLRIADQVIDVVDGRAKVLSSEEIHEELRHPHFDYTSDSKRSNGVTQGQSSENTQEEATQEEEGQDNDALEVKEAPEEPSEKESVSMSVFTKYMKAGGWFLWVLLAMFIMGTRFFDISRSRLFEAWGGDTADTSGPEQKRFWGLPDPAIRPGAWLSVLAGISMAQSACYAISQVCLAWICINAAQGLFKVAVDRIGKATFRYYDITPTGQLKNRLIADMNMVDGGILAPLESFVYNFIALAVILIAIMAHQPSLIVIVGAVGLIFVYFFRIYVPISRCLRRMEMRYLTPIIANIGVMQDGLVTIRALQVEGVFQDRHLDAVDDFQKQDHFFWSMSFWLDFRLGLSTIFMRLVLILFMMWTGTPASAIGFVLTQTQQAMVMVQSLCEKFAQLQLDAVSLERVEMLNKIPEEPSGGEEPPEDWPGPGDAVKAEGMSFRYAEGLPEVLKEVSFEIPGGSTCAVLGRTGSGKSTIANALLVTENPSRGTIKVGGLDLAQVNRSTLRNRVTFVQQDPTLFPGTLRDNIDPEGRFSDAECSRAIGLVLGPQWGLESPIDAAGKNLSQGQRQLVSIGRAVLRRSGLVILDEATASIDRNTAADVQRILREELADSTVVTIAHRLEAVEDANWCLRLGEGKVVLCGPASKELSLRGKNKGRQRGEGTS